MSDVAKYMFEYFGKEAEMVEALAPAFELWRAPHHENKVRLVVVWRGSDGTIDVYMPVKSGVVTTEEVARVICDELGLDFGTLYQNKGEWIKDRSQRHDINTPYQCEVLAAAKAVITKIGLSQ